MKITLISIFAFISIAQASVLDIAKQRCNVQINEEYVYSDDFSWNITLEKAKEYFDKVYHSDKRLKNRAYFKKDKFIMKYGKEEVVVPERFIVSIIKHVESALKRKYVDFIIFPDMGHSHYFIPEKFYDEELKDIPNSDKATLYNKMFSHPELKILYHTAEQLKMKDEKKKLVNDRHMQWRFFTRNIVGDNKMQGHLEIIHEEKSDFNTAHTYQEGYRYWGGGFNISANKNGCFPFKYNNQTFYFDISFDDLQASTSNSNSSDYF